MTQEIASAGKAWRICAGSVARVDRWRRRGCAELGIARGVGGGIRSGGVSGRAKRRRNAGGDSRGGAESARSCECIENRQKAASSACVVCRAGAGAATGDRSGIRRRAQEAVISLVVMGGEPGVQGAVGGADREGGKVFREDDGGGGKGGALRGVLILGGQPVGCVLELGGGRRSAGRSPERRHARPALILIGPTAVGSRSPAVAAQDRLNVAPILRCCTPPKRRSCK